MGNKKKKKQARTSATNEAAPRASESKSPAQSWKHGWLPAIWGGVAGGLAFEPVAALHLGFAPLSWLVFLAPVGLFFAMRAAPTPRGAFVRVLGGGFILYFLAMGWLLSLSQFSPAILGIPLVAFGIPGVALYAAFYVAGAAWLTRRFFPTLPAFQSFVVFAALWLFVEWFRTLGRLAMPWALLGHAFNDWPSVIQYADVFGELGMSALVLFGSSVIIQFLQNVIATSPDGGGLKRLLGFPHAAGPFIPPTFITSLRPIIHMAILVGILLTSAIRYAVWNGRVEKTPDEERLTIACVQPAIDQTDKMIAAGMGERHEVMAEREKSKRLHEELIASLPPEIDLIVMPETTFPGFDFSIDERLHRRIESMVLGRESDILFGASRIVLDESKSELKEAYNSAWFLPHGQGWDAAQAQDKMHLVPFGEYVPYADLIPGLDTLIGIGAWDEGTQIPELASHGHPFGILICYESSSTGRARDIIDTGATFLVVVTNDAWYGRSAGPRQHHDLSVMRAIETRKPLIRAANTGISSLFTPSGKVSASLPLGERGVLTGTIAPRTGRTPFVRWGNIPLLLAILVVLVVAFRDSRPANS